MTTHQVKHQRQMRSDRYKNRFDFYRAGSKDLKFPHNMYASQRRQLEPFKGRNKPCPKCGRMMIISVGDGAEGDNIYMSCPYCGVEEKLYANKSVAKLKKKNKKYNYIDWCKGTCNKNTYVSSKGFCKECTDAGEFGA